MLRALLGIFVIVVGVASLVYGLYESYVLVNLTSHASLNFIVLTASKAGICLFLASQFRINFDD